MVHSNLPLVSIVTPVYNGEKFLVECIESVLAQSYQNWDYVIVNNCSTDRTLKIAQSYASNDKRITVVTNRQFVGIVENHNIAFQHISPQSKYCKVVEADDWLYPECVSKLVELAEPNPAVGIVGSYAISAKEILQVGLPLDATIFSGHDVCRLWLLGAIGTFGTPSALLYRSSLVRHQTPFFPGSYPSADGEACFISLRTCDFAFSHQILSFQRVHDESMSSKLSLVNSFLVDRLQFLEKYGPVYLEAKEFATRREEVLSKYYECLAIAAIKFRGREFWNYHKRRAEELGYPLVCARLVVAIGRKILDLLLNPKLTIEKAFRR
jgi:glycosyltransferase involved in cell wall biosynthesis